jgi:competence protein ComEC
LVAQPYWLWDLGFQLSFSAVLSIVLFAKPIQQVLITRIQFLQSVTTLIAVTLAAQLLTSPFTLYYFQQFPLGFLLSNLVAVPLSTCILYILLLLLLTAIIPFVGTGIGMIAKTTIAWMNQYIRLISEIPGIQLDELHWTWGEAFLLLIVILTGAGCLLLKCKSSTLLTVIGGCLLITWQCCDYFLHQKQKALIIYQSKSNTIISWINGNQALHILDSNGRAKVVKKNRLIKASNRYYRIQRQTDTLLTPYFQVGNWTIIVPNRKFEPPTLTGRGKETILLISKAAPYYGSSWVQNQTITIAVLDGTLGVRTRANWNKLFNARGIPVHDMLTAGAFVHSSSSSTFALLSTLHTP